MQSFLSNLNAKRSNGFTLVEVLVVSPLFILLIGTMIFAAVSLTGSSIQTNEKNAIMADIQTSFDSIENEVSRGSAYLATTGTVTSPQGSDDSSGAPFVVTPGASPDYKSAGPIIIQSVATTKSPYDSTRDIVYSNSPDSTCNSSTVTSNTPYPVTYVYFVKNNILWKRTIPGSSTITGTCSTPWQKPSCAVGYSSSYCKAEDEKIMENVASIDTQYFATASSTTALASPAAARVLKMTVNGSKAVAGTTLTNTSSTTIMLSSAPAASGSASFAYTGAVQNWTVPVGVSTITIECWGAQGAVNGNGATGGLGGYSKGSLSVASGSSMSVYVGGAGSGVTGGYNGGGGVPANGGGGGGGGSDVRSGGTALSNRVIACAGGGGAGYNNSTINGGAGGGSTGANGSNYSYSTDGGGGGSQSSGGYGGSYNGSYVGSSGALGVGGASSSNCGSGGGGGGGGGYYGGGGGGVGAGGGGSSYVGGLTSTTTTSGTQTGNGKITISW